MTWTDHLIMRLLDLAMIPLMVLGIWFFKEPFKNLWKRFWSNAR